MSPYRHIVCPVDFSDVSKVTLEWTLELAASFESRLTVLHVIDTGLIKTQSLFAVPDAVDEMRVRAEEQFHALTRELDLSRARFEMVEGVPARAIPAAAKDWSSDLLVMGTHGWSGVQRLLLGSVTEKVLHRAEIPLLAASSGAKRGTRFETILLAVDFDGDSQTAMRHALWLAERCHARVIAAHIVPVPYVVLNDRTLQRLSPQEFSRLEENLSAERRARIADLLPETAGVDVEVVTKVGDVFALLREIVTGEGVDLVVMGAGGHGVAEVRWLGSTCHKMVRLGQCPVLIAR